MHAAIRREAVLKRVSYFIPLNEVTFPKVKLSLEEKTLE
jgi:hypothetical protein